jgi:hypothetical protein
VRLDVAPQLTLPQEGSVPSPQAVSSEHFTLLKVSTRSVKRAHKVKTKGAPELADAVKAGDVSLHAATA